jgi:uncharacterized protein DUF3352
VILLLIHRLRSRFTLNRMLIAIVAVAAFLGVTSLVQDDGSSHTDHAVALVPQNALLYAHLEVDRSSTQWRNATRILDKLPALGRLRDQALGQLAAGRPPGRLDADLRPWLGDEAALALLPEGRRATSLVLLKVGNLDRAKSFLAGAGQARIALYRGTQVRMYKTLAAAFIDDFLAIGRLPHVRAAIDASEGQSLSDSSVYQDARDGLSLDGPLLYAYAPGDGVRRLLQQQKGIVGRLGDALARPALRGTAAAVRFEGKGLRVSTANVDYPRLPGAAGADPTFEPQLLRSVPQDAMAYYGVIGVTRLFDRLEALSGGRDSEVARAVARLRRQLRPSGVRALRRALRPLERREAALIVTPPEDAPVVSLIVGDTTRSEGGNVLIALQPLISRVVQSTSGGAAATLVPGSEAGIDTITLQINPDLSLTYATLGDRIMVTTDPAGVRQVAQAEQTLLGEDAFAPGMRGLLKEATSVVFLDLHRLSTLIERAGLGTTPEYRTIEPELARIGALSVITQSEGPSQTRLKAAEAFIEVP